MGSVLKAVEQLLHQYGVEKISVVSVDSEEKDRVPGTFSVESEEQGHGSGTFGVDSKEQSHDSEAFGVENEEEDYFPDTKSLEKESDEYKNKSTKQTQISPQIKMNKNDDINEFPPQKHPTISSKGWDNNKFPPQKPSTASSSGSKFSPQKLSTPSSGSGNPEGASGRSLAAIFSRVWIAATATAGEQVEPLKLAGLLALHAEEVNISIQC